MEVKVSVIVPIYNVEKYLDKCVMSLIHQTLQDIEIVLVDDGSPDNCGMMCDDYSTKDSRITVIHKKNGGLSSARNAGIKIAKGEYLMFVDSDDWVEPNFCETALDKLEKYDVDILSFGYNWIKSDDSIKEMSTDKDKILSSEKGIEELITLKDVIYNLPCNKIYKAKLFEGIEFPDGRLYEDQGTTYKLFHKAKSIAVITDRLYNYIQRGNSIQGGRLYKPKGYYDRLCIWEERYQFVKKNYPRLENPAMWQIFRESIDFFRYVDKKDAKYYMLTKEKIYSIYKTYAFVIISSILYKVKDKISH